MLPVRLTARLQPRSRGVRLAGALWLLALTALAGWAALRSPPGRADPLTAGLAAAAANCARARGLPLHGRRPWFSTAAVEAALDDPRVQSRAHGELDALHDEAVWLGRLRGVADLGDRSRGDLVFLAALLHDYLAIARHGEPARCDHRVPQPERVVFRDLTPADVLAAWD